MTQNFSPELLAPAGSPESLRAALSAGADAVYLGLSRFNARAGAENFDKESLKEAVKLCRLYGKKLYITLNTIVFDKEIPDVLNEVEDCMRLGVDAFIVQDFGLISLLKRVFPDIVLHASTQCATHSLSQIIALSEMGVERVVVARETSRRDLETIMKNTPVEIEAFVHGALCMSHSGTCLMSTYMGGRSGNRGECAQPCRLPYSMKNNKNNYPLSLKDLSLARHTGELIDLGIHSFKIEGRMKSPAYVYGVVKIWRRLIDERRGATDEEMLALSRIFSRDGFTDGYYTEKKGSDMFGTRRDSDKALTREAEKNAFPEPEKMEADIEFYASLSECKVTFSHKGVCGMARAEVQKAEGSGTGEDVIRDALTKLGSTPFTCRNISLTLPHPIFIKRSVLNEMRREAVADLCDKLTGSFPIPVRQDCPEPTGESFSFEGYCTVFRDGSEIGRAQALKLLEKDEILQVFLPYSTDFECPDERCGIALPRAVFDRENEEFEKRLENFKRLGYRKAFCENLGVAALARSHGFEIFGGAGLNAANSYAVDSLRRFGFSSLVLSCETTPAQRRGMAKSMRVGETVYGKAGLMLLENCPIGVRDGCISSHGCTCRKRGTLTDRQGENFPVVPDAFHRAVIYNSRPTYIADTPAPDGVSFRVIYITDEKWEEVVSSVLSGKAPSGKFTRK